MTLSRREGVDIRPTLLRVLTDLYVQASTHSRDEERQFVELTSRLIDQVDDATRAVVRARLVVYPGAPAVILNRLGLEPSQPDFLTSVADDNDAAGHVPPPIEQPVNALSRIISRLSMQPPDAAEITDMFFRAKSSERALILHNLAETPLKAAARIPAARAARATETLEMAAFVADVENFTLELGDALILPSRIAAQLVNDSGGEPLACAAKALHMPSPVFQRVLLFLNPAIGCSVNAVYRLSRLYDRLSERSALVMLGAWRGSSLATARAKHLPVLHDDERQSARSASAQTRPTLQPGSGAVVRTGTQGSER